jgi:hypothetical protein
MPVLRFDPSRRLNGDNSSSFNSALEWGWCSPPNANFKNSLASIEPEIRLELESQIARFLALAKNNPDAARTALGVGECLLTELGA